MTEAKPWTQNFYPIDGVVAIPSVDPDLIALWEQSRGGVGLPKWSGYDMFDLRPWLGFVAVEQVSIDPFDCTMRLWGTHLRDLYGFDATGWRMTDSVKERGLTGADFAFSKRVVTEPCIAVSNGRLDWIDREHRAVQRVFLPFSEDGQDAVQADTIVSVVFMSGL